jgi:RNA polymerase sigma factor (TIGR02999 family)
MTRVTEILSAVQRGDRQAAGQLLPLVYDELRKLASQRLAREGEPHSLNATALVHEAYLRLVGNGDQAQWDGRGHFFAAAAEAMRRILVDSARARQSRKRGGDHVRQELEITEIPMHQPPAEVIAVNDALDHLAKVNPPAADLVKLRYFAGFPMREAAEILGIAPRTADSLWAYSRAWLALEIGGT